MSSILSLFGPETYEYSLNSFEEFPVCPGCKSVYTTPDCIETSGSRQKAKVCKRKIGYTACTVKKTANSTVFCPIQTFCFQTISSLIAYRVANSASFLKECKAWRKAQQSAVSTSVILSDVYEGAIWKDFQSFLQTPHNLLLQFNVDWFKPSIMLLILLGQFISQSLISLVLSVIR